MDVDSHNLCRLPHLKWHIGRPLLERARILKPALAVLQQNLGRILPSGVLTKSVEPLVGYGGHFARCARVVHKVWK